MPGKRRWFLTGFVAASMLAAGCGDDDSSTPTTTAAAAHTTTAAPSTTAPAETSAPETTAQPAGFDDASVEREADGSLTISWSGEVDGPVEIRWSTDPEQIDQSLTTVDSGSSTTVDDPAPGGRAFFRLVAGDAELTVAERRVPLEGVPNFRDLGGYRTEDGRRVKWGQVYRSGALFDLTPADLEVVETIGIRLVCDLRSDSEVEEEPDPQFAGEHIRLSVNDESVDVKAITDAILAGDLDMLSPDLLLEGMPRMATEFPEEWKTLLERIGDPESRPTNLHCTGGKDRAGWASALVLRTLGVPEETVMEDYLLSNEFLAESFEGNIAQVRTIVANAKGVPEDQVDTTNLEKLLYVEPAYLQAAFDAVEEKFGSFDQYLTDGLGLTEDQMTALRDSLLE